MRYFLFGLIICALTGCHTGFYRGLPSDHFDGKKFYYPGEKNKDHFLMDLSNLWFAILTHPWPEHPPEIHYPVIDNHPNGIKITFINHSTVLLQTKTANLLFDPIWSYRASPFSFIGPERIREPGIKFSELPSIDIVLISHNHYDHMDIDTLQKLNTKFHPVFIVPLGNKIFLNNYHITNVVELDWWQIYKWKNITIHLFPAHHSSTRWLFDHNWTLWGSYGININNKKIYFGGDTGYANHFKLIRSRWGSPDFSFLPIGAYEPHDLMKPDHLNPQEAVKAHQELGSRTSMGIHWHTFQLSSEPIEQPMNDLIVASAKANLSPNEFFVSPEGLPFFIK